MSIIIAMAQNNGHGYGSKSYASCVRNSSMAKSIDWLHSRLTQKHGDKEFNKVCIQSSRTEQASERLWNNNEMHQPQ